MKIKNNKKITVGIIFGGKSPEHEVSISSAEGIRANIDREQFKIEEIYIDKQGKYWVRRGKSKTVFDPFCDSAKVDIFFPVLHGAGGEDGEIQGLIKALNKPFVGADILASSICLDKAIFKQLLFANRIPQAKFQIIDYRKMSLSAVKAIMNKIARMRFPLFVKPSRLGSSVGISKVKNKTQLLPALRRAKKFDFRIVVEEAVENCREIEVAVIGNKDSDIMTAIPGMIMPNAEFYTYDDKYKNGRAKATIPAHLSHSEITKIRRLAVAVYKLVCGEGFARVDFLCNEKGIYINEINTIPGFTPISMFPKMWQANGVSYKDLITRLIQLGFERNKC